MASEQLRKENKPNERQTYVEKDKVPKMASQFEALTVQDQPGSDPVVHHSTAGATMQSKDGSKGPSLEEIARYRGTAQENSIGAIKAAEERYQKAKGSTVQKGGQPAKQGSPGAVGYVGEKAVAAKDVAVEAGKTTVGYVGKAAEVVKDKAVVAGWTAAEAVANVTGGVAGYAGSAAVATKDAVVNVGKKTTGLAADAKDKVVETEESAKEYAARKKAEKQRELEAKRSAQSKGEGEMESESMGSEGGYDMNTGCGWFG